MLLAYSCFKVSNSNESLRTSRWELLILLSIKFISLLIFLINLSWSSNLLLMAASSLRLFLVTFLLLSSKRCFSSSSFFSCWRSFSSCCCSWSAGCCDQTTVLKKNTEEIIKRIFFMRWIYRFGKNTIRAILEVQ